MKKCQTPWDCGYSVFFKRLQRVRLASQLLTHPAQISSSNPNSKLIHSLDTSVHPMRPHSLSEADNWAPAGPSFPQG